MPTARINDFDLSFEDRGEGEPLLLLHGGMGIGADWRHVFSSDPPGWRVIVPDLRGHGRSTNPSGTFTFRQCARDVIALLGHLGIDRIKAIGMSMGAKTLLHVATMRPAAVSAMVLVSATPRFTEPLRAAAATFTREAYEGLSESEKDAFRARHVHGDEQILQLYDMTRSFATSTDDIASPRQTSPRLPQTRSSSAAIREYLRDEQRSEPGCPAREVVLDQRGRATNTRWSSPSSCIAASHAPHCGWYRAVTARS